MNGLLFLSVIVEQVNTWVACRISCQKAILEHLHVFIHSATADKNKILLRDYTEWVTRILKKLNKSLYSSAKVFSTVH